MSKRILLVVNNKSNAQMLSQHLREEGYEVILAKDGQEGFDLFLVHSPSVMIIDMLLPKISGSELCQRIREVPESNDVSIVLVSSIFKNMDLSRISKSRWNVDLFFKFPLDMDVFKQEIKRIIKEKPETHAADDKEPISEIVMSEAEAIAMPADPISDMSEKAPDAEELDLAIELDEDEEVEPQEIRQEVRREFHLKEIALKGSLRENSVPEILAYLHYHDESGLLTFNSQEASKKVYFKDGNPVYVESRLREENLGRMLVRDGIISQEDCFLSLNNMRTYHKQQGGALVMAGALTPLQLMEALQRQMRQKIINLFAWFEGEYLFEQKTISTQKAVFFELSVPDLVVAGICEYYEPASIQIIFDEISKLKLRRKDYLPFHLAELELTTNDKKLLELADGSRNIEALVLESVVDPARSFRVLYSLILLGAFEGIVDEEQAEIADDEPGESLLGSIDLDLLEESTEKAIERLEQSAMDIDPERIDSQPETDVIPISPTFEPENSLDQESIFANDFELQDEAAVLVQNAEVSNQNQDAMGKAIGSDKPLEMLVDQESSAFFDLSPEDREFRDQILADYLSLEGANHYQVMNLEKDATPERIKKCFLRLAKKYHADTLGDKFDPGVVQKANEIFSRITEAYKTLLDTKKREKYDSRLSESGEEKQERKISNILIAENHFNHGLDCLKRNDFQIAVKEFQSAVDLFPEESEFHSYLGWTTFNVPTNKPEVRFNKSLELIQKGIALNPKSDMAYFFLGKVLKERGQIDQAMHAFAKAFQFNRKNFDAKHELKNLQYEKIKARNTKANRPHKGMGWKAALTTDIDLKTVRSSIMKIFKS